MKVLLSNKQESKDGYLSICDMNTLDMLVENGEADELIIDNFLSKFTTSRVPETIAKILTKVKLKGRVVIVHNDINILAWQLARDIINLDVFNNIVFSDGPILSALEMSQICNFLKENNFDIKSKRLVGPVAVVTGERNA